MSNPAVVGVRRVRFNDPSGLAKTGEWTRRGIEFGDEIYEPKDVDFLPPVSPNKIIAVGPNHESNVQREERVRPETPAELELFVKTGSNSLVAHQGTAVLRNGGTFIYELELGIVIGAQCANVPKKAASGVIEGYTCVNEITNTALPTTVVAGGDNWARAKSFDNSAPLGPAVATPDEVPDDARMELRVNGERKQQATRSELLFTDAELVEEISKYITLDPGDVIATGSPRGAAPLSDGDAVELEIEGIGTLRHDVRILP